MFTKLKKYSKVPDFKAEAVGKVSLACRSLCLWVLAMEHYNEVYKVSQFTQVYEVSLHRGLQGQSVYTEVCKVSQFTLRSTWSAGLL